MKSKSYDRQISLICITCGESQFEYDNEIPDEVREYKCFSCERIYTKDELFKENGEIIYEQLNEIGEELLNNTANKLDNVFKKSFNRNKNFKFK